MSTPNPPGGPTTPNPTGRDDARNPTAGREGVPGSQGPGPRTGEGRSGGRRRGRGGRGEQAVVPDATFTSYYGRPVVKASPWEADIPAYLFLGGVAAGSSLLAAGGDLTGRPAVRRAGRIAALGALAVSFAALVHDLGKPVRFVNMLRVIKPTSPMSVGTWILSAYAPGTALAGAAEVAALLPWSFGWPGRLLRASARPGGIAAAVIAPGVASYTAVLLTDTATPAWHSAYRELPFVFVGSAAAAAGGLSMITAPTAQAGPARRLALAGAATELTAETIMERSMGLSEETLRTGTAGTLMRISKLSTALGAAGTLLAGRSRVAAVLSGLALLTGSVCTRFGIFHAGQASARDPKYTVVPQRERLDERDGRPAQDPAGS
ncbi:formate-dependent nitrite reductase membrane component NrfD [Friedmanniella endophytica]|uniref:Formate-dependent nitrite reductase membrane component NrfD n=1 Tax=Microlunatus kandeliicorticis TaxID=1759536 RepID=A0A7W3P464_9ACTN|nr:NrfD/PsrC family molybdoenzyme membrane anchor subunit [Microlunatus kandeliicorticis]MBA8792569.1 formate-dependent nitrite reductase membrane component NrfD [Microlunatus kandeliicorticis]